jgi:hypothetical protein
MNLRKAIFKSGLEGYRKGHKSAGFHFVIQQTRRRISERFPDYPEEYCHGNVKRRLKHAIFRSKSEIRSGLDRGFSRLRKRPDILLGCFQHAGLKLKQLW